MKKVLLALTLAVAFASTLGARTRKALYVIVDGIPATALERLQPPTIMEIAREGGYARGYCGGAVGRYSETPTISAIGYSNINTGTWMNKHNVHGNSNMQPNYNYPTIFRIAKDQPRPVTTAVYTSWTDNRTILLGVGRPENRNLKVDYIVDGFDLDHEKYPNKPGDLHVFDYDTEVCKSAAEIIRKNAPDLNWLYLWYSDDAYHLNGNGPVADWSVMAEDSLLRQVWQAVKERQKNHDEDWLVIVTTDHGRAYNGFGHGGQSDTERTIWMATNLKKRNAQFSRPTLSHVDILPTICRWMGFTLPQATAFELDGTSFYGKEDICNLRLEPWDKKVTLSWENCGNDVPADIYCATSNNIAQGKDDEWVKLATVSSKKGRFTLDNARIANSPFVKFSVKTPNTTLNTWWKQ